MINFTTCANVANSFLKVLQGYTKGIRFIALLTMLCTIGVGNAWADDVTFSWAGSATADGGKTDYVVEQTPVTLTFAAGTAQNAPRTNKEGSVRMYANTTLTISCASGNITKVTFTPTSASYNATKLKYNGTALTSDEWTLSSPSNEVTLTASAAARFETIVVTYTSAGGGDEPPTPSTTYTIKWHTTVGETTDVILNEGAAITKPATNPTMSGYVFMGWTEACEVASNGSDFTAITNFGTATEDKDYYAVFAEATTTGGGGGGTTEVTIDLSKKNQVTTNSTTSLVFTERDVTFTNTKVSGQTDANNYCPVSSTTRTSTRTYNGHKVTIAAGSTISKIVITAASTNYATVIKDATWTNGSATASSSTVTVTPSSGVSTVSFTPSATAGMTKVVVTTGGGGSTTYDNYITTCAGSDTPETFTVTFNANGHGTAPAAQTITSGETASEPTEPKETGYTFGGWYENQQCTGNQFNFDTPITADITLYAKWTIATYTIKATLEYCNSTQEIPTTYQYTGDEINWSYNITPEDGYGLPRTITFSGPTYTWDQSTGTLTLTGVIKSDVTFTITAKKIHTIKWMVDGEEYTNGEPSTTVLNNERVSKLPTNPTLDCSGKTFVGWSDQEVTDGNKPSVLFTSAETSPQVLKNTIFHAVFATLTGSGNGQNTTDVLTHEINGKNSGNTNYTAFTEKKYNSDAIYAGNTANSHGGVQLRGSDGSGIVTTTSGGYAKSITIEWNSNTTDGRILDIYGKNEVYSAASDLYNNDGKGTKLGSITCGTSTKLTIDGDYQYIGLRSNSNAIYLNSISIVWSSSAAPTYTGYTTTCTFTAPELDPPTNLTVTDLTCSSVTLSWEEVENATGYEVVRTLNAHNTSYTTTENYITIENLEGGNENSWKVRAIGDGINYNNSEYADGENFTTLFSVKYYVDEVLWNGCANGCVANGSNFTICEETPTKANNTFIGWATSAGGEVAYQAGEIIYDIAANVTLHAVWDAVTYIVNWSVNGEDHIVPYTYGQALELPEIDITPCDGMDHVGWTDNMGYVPGTDILFTETTDMTVTSDKTYYAVFATLTSSGGGETTTTLNFSQQGYANQEKVTSLEIGGVTVSFSQGEASDPPAYYNTGTAIRVYAKGSFTVSSTNTISQIEITFGTGDGTNEISTNVGDYSDGTWKGSANEIIFTVGGDSKHRRIKSIAVTSAGGGASYYTGHTTTCSGSQQLATPTNLQATDITHNGATLTWDAVAGANKYKVVINGTEYISNINSYTTHALKQQTAYTWTVQAIGNGTTFTDSEISAEDTFTTGTELVITWSVSTATSTTTITKGQPIGANLKTPATPAACEGKYFMGWSASSTVNSDGSDFTPITSDIIPETNVTYYAVFAEPTSDGNNVGDLFHESFDTMNGKGGNDGTWNGISSSTDAQIDGWSFTKGYVASQCIRLGTGSVAGQATTPALSINGNATLTFNAGAWNGNSENLTINLQIVGEGSIAPSSVTLTKGKFNTYTANITGANADTKVQFIAANAANNRFFLDEVKVSGGSSDSYTDYSTSCGTYTITFYGFNSGGYTTICGNNPAEIAVAQGETYQIPDCEPTFDPAGLGRTFTGTWNTQADGKGTAYEPGDEIVNVSNDITLYAQWALNTSESTTLPTDVEDLATTDIVVTGGTTLTLAAGTTTINSLTLKGGLQADGSYAMPIVKIPTGATLVRNNTTINLDLVVNSDSWYPFAVPFAATNNANVEYLDPTLAAASTYGTHFAIKTYDGARRAEEGVDQTNNWVQLKRNEKLQPGVGYIISAMTYPDKDTATIRIPMSVSNDWLANGELTTVNEVTRNAVEVTAYTGAAATEHQRHAGWNFVANPYLANFAGTNASGSFINGEIIINKGDYSYGGDDVPYVTIPTYNFAHYYQVKLSDATLSPAYSFFVQVDDSGTMTFETDGRQAAPASIAARNAEERPVKMDVDITLSDNHSSDQTGIIISDRYSDAYEIGRDLEKLFGSAYNLSVYTLMADNTPLAFQALAIRSNMQVIPVGYRTPAQGEYTFRLNEATSSIDLLNEQYEQLVLVDYQTGELTNLLIADYTFYSERTQADNRFAIYAVPRQNAPTDLPNAIGQDKQAQKIIHNGHLYILRDGNVYNGNGQIVK